MKCGKSSLAIRREVTEEVDCGSSWREFATLLGVLVSGGRVADEREGLEVVCESKGAGW